MASFKGFRHVKALTLKNWATSKRQPCLTIFQMVCPGLLMLFIVWTSTLFKTRSFSPEIIGELRKPMFMLATETNENGTLVIDTQATNEAVRPFFNYTTYPPLWYLEDPDVEYDVILDENSPLYFNPANCKKKRSFVIPKVSSTIIGVVGKQSDSLAVTNDTANYLKAILDWQMANTTQEWKNKNTEFEIRWFDDQAELFDYISSDQYEVGDNPGVCLAFEIILSGEDSYDVSLYFDTQVMYGGFVESSIPRLSKEPASTVQSEPMIFAYKSYTDNGYTFIQNVIANIILQSESNMDARIDMMASPVASDQLETNWFQYILESLLELFVLVMFLIPLYLTVFIMATERESRSRESMRMMGMVDTSYFISWFLYYTLQVTIISTVAMAVLCINVIEYSQPGYVFLWFWVLGESLFGQILVFQTFFKRSKYAGLVSAVIYLALSFTSIPMALTTSSTKRHLWCIIPQAASQQMAYTFAVYEESGIGLTHSTIDMKYDFMTYNELIYEMIGGGLVFLILGIYLDNVMPTAIGGRKNPCFCFMPRSYSCCKKKSKTGEIIDDSDLEDNSFVSVMNVDDERNNVLLTADLEAEIELKSVAPENYESVPAEIGRQEALGQILKIENLLKVYENGFKAVKGLNLRMYQNQIFALLGQNGAGKTTTISMLSGLIEATKGKATAFGIDMFEEKEQLSNILGVCPQHDILFDYLTPEEHLEMFYAFKGGDKSKMKQEIEDLIIDVGLGPDRKKMAKSLSGGNKRKLSVAIAMCAGSKVVMLDEPTAGMDIGARRLMWEMLKNYKRNKIIILTTHYMDEADVLGDRIGIMSKGEMRCLGSGLFLKNRFGAGYRLTMVKKRKRTNQKVGPYLQQYFGSVELMSEIAQEITYLIPKNRSHLFTEFFSKFDEDLDRLEIDTYGVSITTLEEVFLKVQQESRQTDISSCELTPRSTSAIMFSTRSQSYRKPGAGATANESILESTTEIDSDEEGSHVKSLNSKTSPDRLIGNGTVTESIIALLTKRFHIYKRDRIGLVCEVCLPWLMVLLGCLLTLLSVSSNGVDYQVLVPSAYPSPQHIIMNEKNVIQSSDQLTPDDLFKGLPIDSTVFDLYQTDNASTYQEFANQVYQSRLYGDPKPYRYGSYQIYNADQSDHNYQFVTYMNITSPVVAAFFPQFMYESILKQATDKKIQFQVQTTPFPKIKALESNQQNAESFDFSFCLSIALSLLPIVMIQYIIGERENDLKHIQMISGISLPGYWIANMIADIIKCYLPIILILITTACFGINYQGVWALLLIYPFAEVPFTYCASFLFQNDGNAQMVTILGNLIVGAILAPLVFFFQVYPPTFILGDQLRWGLCCIPIYPVINGLLWSADGVQFIPAIRSGTNEEIAANIYGIQNVGGDLLALVLQSIVYTGILALIEIDVFRFTRDKTAREIPPPDTSLKLDEDVMAEEVRVAATESDVIRVNDFRKAYTTLIGKPFLAVERLSFGVDYGEVFCLLGVNGAGKSTTFKTLTAHTTPTQGQVTIEQNDIQKEFSKARKLIGYCPQHDAIFPLMTVMEHLNFYAVIKGLPVSKRYDVIEKLVKELSLDDFRETQAGLLSGGNKRKLSVGIAIMGNPPIILLDEPSAGMDPEARRFMWQVVSNISKRDKNSAVILTTHSMEEAEALSTKMGIMVRGGIFRCFGSSQHIKSKYGTGFELEIKIHKPTFQEKVDFAKQLGFKEPITNLMNLWKGLLKCRNINDIIIEQVTDVGIGSDLYKEAEQNEWKVRLSNLITFIYTQIYGIKVIERLVKEFEQVELIEQCGDFFKFRLPREGKTTGYLLGLVEDSKEEMNLQQYSVSQTSLEQIFQNFANDSVVDGKTALFFNLDENGQLQVINKDGKQTIEQRSNSKIGLVVPKETITANLPYEGLEGINYSARGSQSSAGKIWDNQSMNQFRMGGIN